MTKGDEEVYLLQPSFTEVLLLFKLGCKRVVAFNPKYIKSPEDLEFYTWVTETYKDMYTIDTRKRLYKNGLMCAKSVRYYYEYSPEIKNWENNYAI